MAHAPVDAVGLVSDGKDGSLIVEGANLVWEESTDGAEQQAADPEGVLPLAALHHRGNLPCLIPLHKHSPKHSKAVQLGVVRIRRHRRCRVKGLTRRGGGGAAGGPVPTHSNCPRLMEVTEHRLILQETEQSV